MQTLQAPPPALRPSIVVTKAHAQMLLDFAVLQPRACRRCRVPMPFWGTAPGNGGYWYQPAPAPCAKGCDTVLIGLWAKLVETYTIAPRDKAPFTTPVQRSTARRRKHAP